MSCYLLKMWYDNSKCFRDLFELTKRRITAGVLTL